MQLPTYLLQQSYFVFYREKTAFGWCGYSIFPNTAPSYVEIGEKEVGTLYLPDDYSPPPNPVARCSVFVGYLAQLKLLSDNNLPQEFSFLLRKTATNVFSPET